MSVGERLYCPLAPCLPLHDGGINDEIIRGSRSFVTFEAYERHMRDGHFLSKAIAPLPYWISA